MILGCQVQFPDRTINPSQVICGEASFRPDIFFLHKASKQQKAHGVNNFLVGIIILPLILPLLFVIKYVIICAYYESLLFIFSRKFRMDHMWKVL